MNSKVDYPMPVKAALLPGFAFGIVALPGWYALISAFIAALAAMMLANAIHAIFSGNLYAIVANRFQPDECHYYRAKHPTIFWLHVIVEGVLGLTLLLVIAYFFIKIFSG